MVKYKLFEDEEYDFGLIGICSSHGDYRLSWSINQSLNILLQKGEDYSVLSKKEESFHSFYEYKCEDTRAEYFLIKNLSTAFKHLIAEKDQIDFFLLIRNEYNVTLYEILERLRQLDSVETAFIFNPNDLKSKANLLF